MLNRWHVHTAPQGYYHWSVEATIAKQVTLRVYKRYSGDCEMLKNRLPCPNWKVIRSSLPERTEVSPLDSCHLEFTISSLQAQSCRWKSNFLSVVKTLLGKPMFPDQISNLGARFMRLQKTNDLVQVNYDLT